MKFKRNIPMILVLLAICAISACGINGKNTTDTTDDTSETSVYVYIDRSDVYEIGYSTECHSGGMQNANGSALGGGEAYKILDDFTDETADGTDEFYYSLFAYDENDEVIASGTFLYKDGDGRVDVTLTSDGTFEIY